MTPDEILKKYQTVQPTVEGIPQTNVLQPPGTGPLTPDAILKKYAPPGVLEDIGKTIVGLPRTGAAMLTGMGGALFNTQSYLAGKGMGWLGYKPEEIQAKQAEWDKDRWLSDPVEVRDQTTEMIQNMDIPGVDLPVPVQETLADVERASRYQPKTRAGQAVQTAGLLAPGLLSGGGTLPANLISRVAVPTAMIEGGAEAGKYFGDETMGRLLGGFGAMATPAVFNRLSRPNPAEPGRGAQARVLDREGVPYTAGQRTGNEKLLYRESVAGGIPAQQAQGPAFNAAAARTQGGFPPNTNTFSRPVMRGELDRMGAEFGRLADISDAPLTPTLQNQMLDTVIRYQEMPVIGTAVENTVNGIGRAAAANNGRISGAAYKDTNSKIGAIIRNTDDDALRGAMIELKNHLDDAIEQSLPPVEQGAWSTVRQQYRDFLPIEKAKSSMGGNPARGIVTPSALRGGVKAIEGPREIASGNRPMTDLAEAGASIIERVPQSGTAPRLMEKLAGVVPLAAGSGATALGFASGMAPPMATLLGGGVGSAVAALPYLRDAYIRSGLGQALAGRQGPVFPPGARPGLPSVVAPTLRPQELPDQDLPNILSRAVR